jgi:hypothetical protein
MTLPAAPPPCPLLDLPQDLLGYIVDGLIDEDLTNFWRLSRVCRALKALAETGALARRRHLGGDQCARCLRMRTALAEPAIALKRLFSCMPRLTTLDLSGAYWWVRGGGSAVAEAISTAPFARRLEVLRLDHCEELSDSGLMRLCSDPDSWKPTLPRLRELSLRSCRYLHSARPLRALFSLERLDLAWCVGMHGLAVNMLCSHVPGLRYLDLTGIEVVPGTSFRDGGLTRGMVELRLATTPVGDDDLFNIGDALPDLRRLVLSKRAGNLWADGLFTDAGVAEFRRRRPEVEVVFVT